VRAVVEAPKGARVKTKWIPNWGRCCSAGRYRMGLAYPFDFGFIPGRGRRTAIRSMR